MTFRSQPMAHSNREKPTPGTLFARLALDPRRVRGEQLTGTSELHLRFSG